MPLANGRHFLAIPGPSVMPDEVLRAMHRPSANIYDGELVDMTVAMTPDLKAIARTDGHAMTYIANGHGVWEAALTNTLNDGDKVLVLESGRFAIGWAEMAEKLGITCEIMNAPARRGVDPQMVEDRLRADTAGEIKAILVVQIDTSSGVWNDIQAIGAAIRAAGHDALYMVDCMASLGCVEYEMDKWGADVTTCGSQKGLMTPPGLGFVWANDRALDKGATLTRGRSYWDWDPRAKPEMFYQRFCGTAPVQHLYALRAALDMIADEGMEAIWARHAALAEGVRAAVEHWGRAGGLTLNIIDENARSNSVTTILTNGFDAEKLRGVTEEKLGVTLGVGLGLDPQSAFRIGHMGHVNAPMILGTLGAVELALQHMDAPFTPGGVEAAIRAMKQSVA